MKIIYGFSGCSEKKYLELIGDKIFQPAQKYHGLLIKGLAKNGAEVSCFSGLPINRNVTKRLFIHEKDETEDGVSYHYYKTVNIPFLRQAMILFGAKRAVKKQKDVKDTVVICDLNRANALGMTKGAKKKKLPVVMIVTDLPDFQFDQKLADKYNKLLEKADGFIFLTEQMNERVNKKHKPYIVLEGHSDDALELIKKEEKYEYAAGKKIVVYAGSIQRLYGVGALVEGFIKADIPDAELHIYGDGDYREALEEICKTHPSVKYMGIKENRAVVEAEQKAVLLVNPRPTAPEYTKYSFPSKNMEYMASGTPVMTTKLPGMPTEYYPYVYLIEEETEEGIAKALKEFFSVPLEAREGKGLQARAFVLKNKSNVVQAKKIIEFLDKNFIC